MAPQDSMIPQFREDGYLPEGLYCVTEAQITFRFGTLNRRRRRLILRVRHRIALARQIGARRLLINGSFITAKDEPNDIDAVILLPSNFEHQIAEGVAAAMELVESLSTRRPEEIFAAEDENDWEDWVEFFSRTREFDGRRKGLVEVEL
ncbi:MAG: hypothetical protein C4527_22690 [Candidatus Omnitrophota bacterium]|nr:MAG: hypothetical protein C4527_22690 [Candidatus Omnitrophota bacterium]